MNTPHKHADVLRAIADGEKVQFKDPISGGWFDPAIYNPIANPELEWRSKPEQKPDAVHTRHVGIDVDGNLYMCIAHMNAENLILTFCGETGKLKSAEVTG